MGLGKPGDTLLGWISLSLSPLQIPWTPDLLWPCLSGMSNCKSLSYWSWQCVVIIVHTVWIWKLHKASLGSIEHVEDPCNDVHRSRSTWKSSCCDFKKVKCPEVLFIWWHMTNCSIRTRWLQLKNKLKPLSGCPAQFWYITLLNRSLGCLGCATFKESINITELWQSFPSSLLVLHFVTLYFASSLTLYLLYICF